jgi:hypothetical protein
VFDRLHSKGYDEACFLYAFDLIELDGEDLRKLALVERKLRLRRLLSRRTSGIVYNDHIDGDGSTIFAHACKLGFEGTVSKRRDFELRPRQALDQGEESEGAGGACGSRKGRSDGGCRLHLPCRRCAGERWVCENHPDRPWSKTRPNGCECGAGAPCPDCNAGDPPGIPPALCRA